MHNKILVICDAFYGYNSAASQMRDLCECFVKLGCDITVVTTRKQSEEISFCKTLVFKKLLPENFYFFRLLNEAAFSLQGFMKLKLNRSLSGFDMIIWYSPSIFWGPLVWYLRQKNPSATRLLILRDIFPNWAIELGIIKNGAVSTTLKAIAHLQYQQSERILIQSPGNRIYFEKSKELHEKVEYFPNWLDSKPVALPFDQINSTDLLPKKDKIIIYSGSLGIAQGYEVAEKLIKFCMSSKNYGILFVGRGDHHSKLARSYSATEDVSFVAEVSEQEVRCFYSKCVYGLVLLDPSHRSQNIPGKFISYVRDNLPVIISVNKNNDLRDVVKNNNLGIDLSCCMLDEDYEHLQIKLDGFLKANDGSLHFRKFFEREHTVGEACAKLLSMSKSHLDVGQKL